jgi:uncharacterized membrane protein YkgB
MKFHIVDEKVIGSFKSIAVPFTRVSLFVVYFWFGILKVFGQSPATQLVQDLFEKTVPFMAFGTFFVLFGILECLIGISFLIRGAERIAIVILILHMVTTIMPLFLLPEEMWTRFFVPSMEGQYVIKNLLILSAAVFIGSRLTPIKELPARV